MTTRRNRSGGRRTTVEIVEETLEDLAEDLSELSEKAFDRVLRGTLDDVAEDANTRLADVFERDIEGGPVSFTRITPNSKQSSVINNQAARKAGTDILRSSIKTQRSQSTYLKYALGDEDDREAGDTGAASEWNFVPNPENLRAYQGINVDSHGNLPRNSLSTLVRRSQTGGTRAAYGSKRDRHGSMNDIFFGKSGKRRTMGFWQRQDDNDFNRSPLLLALALPRSAYDGDKLQKGWNRSVEEAMNDLPTKVRKRLRYVLSRMDG